MDLYEKLRILTDSAKYDVACTSSGSNSSGAGGAIGNTVSCGICHTFAADGRCVSLLKVLMSNACVYDCLYCVNRMSNDIERATFTPRELADLTIGFYKRNYIEGLFLSSGVIKNPDYTCERMIESLRILREDYGFGGYIHAKAIPGADNRLLERLGCLTDRMSVNIELPSQQSLRLLAPNKTRESILRPMGMIRERILENTAGSLVPRNSSARFAPAGQSTQLIVGATPESDYQIISLSAALYKKYALKRVFYSAYIPVADNVLLPAVTTKPPLLREHRLYQADWLLRFYGFEAGELLDETHCNFNEFVDPKCNWALNHLEQFPVEVNTAPREMLLRVPGFGVSGVKRILKARRAGQLSFDSLRKLGVTLKRAQYFITCSTKAAPGLVFTHESILRALMSDNCRTAYEAGGYEQLSLFTPVPDREDRVKCLTGQL